MFRCSEIGSVSNRAGYSRAGKWIVQSVDPCILIVMWCYGHASVLGQGLQNMSLLGSCKMFCVFFKFRRSYKCWYIIFFVEWFVLFKGDIYIKPRVVVSNVHANQCDPWERFPFRACIVNARREHLTARVMLLQLPTKKCLRNLVPLFGLHSLNTHPVSMKNCQFAATFFRWILTSNGWLVFRSLFPWDPFLFEKK